MNEMTINNDMEFNLRLLKVLATHPETRTAVIEVVNQNGLITLIGEVDSQEARQTAKKIIANQPGVISVINNLKVTA